MNNLSTLKLHDYLNETGAKSGYTKYSKHGADVFVNIAKLNAIGFTGSKAQNPSFNYKFRNVKQMEHHVSDFFKRMGEHSEFIANRRASRNRPHSLKVNDVLYSSWGYDQTNIDFFQVTKIVSDTMVEVREIASDIVQDTGWMQGTKTAKLNAFVSEPMRKKVNPQDNSLKIDKSRYAWVWDGRPKHYSAYA